MTLASSQTCWKIFSYGSDTFSSGTNHSSRRSQWLYSKKQVRPDLGFGCASVRRHVELCPRARTVGFLETAALSPCRGITSRSREGLSSWCRVYRASPLITLIDEAEVQRWARAFPPVQEGEIVSSLVRQLLSTGNRLPNRMLRKWAQSICAHRIYLPNHKLHQETDVHSTENQGLGLSWLSVTTYSDSLNGQRRMTPL
jgi:hypothetical protein